MTKQLDRDLARLASLTDDADDVADDITATVEAARDSGASWAAIGARLRVSRQAAQQRYGP